MKRVARLRIADILESIATMEGMIEGMAFRGPYHPSQPVHRAYVY